MRISASLPVFSLILISGCWADSTQEPVETRRSQVTPEPFGPSDNRIHDFGAIPGAVGLKLTHRYPITNTSDAPVKVLRAINGKPCCGDVALEPVTLAPGQTAELEVTLRVGNSAQPLSHRAIVETDDARVPALEFFTYATPQPRFVLERESGATPRLSPGESRLMVFTARTYGSADRPAVDLDSVRFEADVPFHWDGPVTERSTPEGLVEKKRKAIATLEADDKPGSRITSIRVSIGNETIPIPSLHWEVAPAIQASPAALIINLKDEPAELKVVVRSLDGKPFVIGEVSSSLKSITAVISESGEAFAHTVKVIAQPGHQNESRTGSIELRTNHPGQPVATIGIFLTNSIDVPKPKDKSTTEEAEN